MTDVHEPTVADGDDLERRLAGALHRHAAAATLTSGSPAAIREAADRHDRRRRAGAGVALVAAAAILVVLVVVRTGGDDDASFVGTGGGDAKPPLHLVLDDAAGYQLMMATEEHLDADGRPPGTTPGPEGYSTFAEVGYGGSDPLVLPRARLTIRTMENPTGPWGDELASNEQAMTVGGRAARLRATQIGFDPSSNVYDTVAMKWDERHEVALSFSGISAEQAATALATLEQDATGRWGLGTPPAGLHELGRSEHWGDGAGWYLDAQSYQPKAGGEDVVLGTTLQVFSSEPDTDEGDLLTIAMSSSYGSTWHAERTSVRGHPAIVTVPEDLDVSLNRTYLWFEPDHDVIVMLQVDAKDPAAGENAVANLREVSTDEWDDLVASCSGVPHGGTTMSMPTTGSTFGGPCALVPAQGG